MSAARRTGRRARVRLDGRACGLIEELDGGGSRFTYDSAWLQDPNRVPASLTMPLREEPYESSVLLPFFANLLPEGWLLEIVTSGLKVAKDDGFGLLLATCRDCMGAVEVLPMDEAAG